MTVTVLPQLAEAEALLSAQEAALMQQLAEIQEKREGLQTVMAMFETSADGNGQSAPAIEALVDLADVAAPKAKSPTAKTVTKSTKATKARGRKPKAAKVAKTTTKTAKTAQTKKANGRAAHWQRYVLDAYRQKPLPDVVASLLKDKPKESFKIARVMSAIFEEDMPKAQFLKARNRISNILSAGARNKEWYRGRGGTYSASEKAVKA
ncbi:MAG: hypothetical protein AAF921_07580 [Cyanobacteria bacterium P01_D01_bin.44]